MLQQNRQNKIDMSKIYLGVDPGSDGYLAVIDNGEYRFLPIKDTPMLEIGKFVGKFKDTQCVAFTPSLVRLRREHSTLVFPKGFSLDC